MNKTLLALTSLMLLAAALPTTTTALPPPPACHDTDNENGFGGTHVYCDFTCPKNAVLTVSVAAHDNEATAAVWTECGGIDAYCDLGTQACTGSSQGTTSSSGWDNCHGRSYETFDSAVTIACSSVGVPDICDYVPQLPSCNPDCLLNPDCPSPVPDDICPLAPDCPSPVPDDICLLTPDCWSPVPDDICLLNPDCLAPATQLCLAENPWLADLAPEILTALFQLANQETLTMVAAWNSGDVGYYVSFDGQNCDAQAF